MDCDSAAGRTRDRTEARQGQTEETRGMKEARGSDLMRPSSVSVSPDDDDLLCKNTNSSLDYNCVILFLK